MKKVILSMVLFFICSMSFGQNSVLLEKLKVEKTILIVEAERLQTRSDSLESNPGEGCDFYSQKAEAVLCRINKTDILNRISATNFLLILAKETKARKKKKLIKRFRKVFPYEDFKKEHDLLIMYL